MNLIDLPIEILDYIIINFINNFESLYNLRKSCKLFNILTKKIILSNKWIYIHNIQDDFLKKSLLNGLRYFKINEKIFKLYNYKLEKISKKIKTLIFSDGLMISLNEYNFNKKRYDNYKNIYLLYKTRLKFKNKSILPSRNLV